MWCSSRSHAATLYMPSTIPRLLPKGFSVEQHFDAAGQMLGRLANDRLIAATA